MNEPFAPNVSTDLSLAPDDALNADLTLLSPKATNSDFSPVTPMETLTQAPGSASTDDSCLTAPLGGDAGAHALPLVSGYRVLHEIARGGMGKVLAAYDLTLDREVALKTLLPGAKGDRFVRESKITARLPHPGIPPVYAMGTLADGSPFLAMKLIAGHTLAQEIKTADRPRLLQVFTQVCQAVGFAHNRGVIHRDLKPANIMIGAFGEVQVMDWGLAKDMTSRDDSRESGSAAKTSVSPVATDSCQTTVPGPQGESTDDRTQAGTVLGTPAYMSPEQARGAVIDTRADVFALGGILCAILTGRPPFVGKSSLEVLQLAMSGNLEDANSRLDACGAETELISLCRRCLSPASANRPTDGQAVADALTSYLNGVQERLQAAERERAVDLARAEEEARTLLAIEEKTNEQRKRRKAQRLLLGSVLGLMTAVGFGIALGSLWQKAERAKLVAVTAQGEAETSRMVAERAQVREEDARKAVESEREKLAVVEYGRTIQVAYENWRDNNLSTARALLDSTRSKPHSWEWDYVDRLCHTELLTLRGHTSGLLSAAFSTDGLQVVTGDFGGTAKLWDAKTGEELLTLHLKGHTNVLNSMSFSADGSLIVTGSFDRTAKVWDAKTGEQVLDLKGHTDEVNSGTFSADGSRIVTGSFDGTAKVWNVETGAELFTLSGNSDKVTSATFSPDGSRIVTSSSNGTAKVWDANSGTEQLTLNGHTGPLNSAIFSADGSRIVTSSDDRTSKLWDASSGEELVSLLGHTQEVRSASFSADGTQIVTASFDRTARVWNATTGAEVLALKGHVGPLSSASFSEAGMQIVTGSGDGTIKLWDTQRILAELTLNGHTNVVFAASLSADGSRVVTGSADSTARLWDANLGAELLTFEGHTHQVQAASFTADGSRVVTGSYDQTAKVWDVNSGTDVLTLRGHSGPVFSVSLSGDGAKVVTGSEDQTARVWDLMSGTELIVLRHKGGVNASSFSTDGTEIVTGSEDQFARVWDATTGIVRRTLMGHMDSVTSASFSADGSLVVTGSKDQTARIWDAKTGDVRAILKGHTDSVTSASFSADGARVITGSLDQTAKIWDATTGAELLSIKQNGPVFSASFSVDGSRVVIAMLAVAKVYDSRRRLDSRSSDHPVPVPLSSRFWALLRGEIQPADNAERLTFADMAYTRKQFAVATQLFSEALAMDSSLGDDRERQLRYNAACVAALTAAEQGYDEPPLSDVEKSKLRHQALDWLKAELSAWARLLESDPPETRPMIAEILKYWQEDSDLVSIRDRAALTQLPANEQEAFTRFWADVAAMSSAPIWDEQQ